jgi:hypothetical protein
MKKHPDQDLIIIKHTIFHSINNVLPNFIIVNIVTMMYPQSFYIFFNALRKKCRIVLSLNILIFDGYMILFVPGLGKLFNKLRTPSKWNLCIKLSFEVKLY